MPEWVPAAWSQIESGDVVLGRDGVPRQILAAQNYYDAHRAWVEIVTTEGTFELNPDQPAVVSRPTMQEAVVTILVAFPGSEIIE